VKAIPCSIHDTHPRDLGFCQNTTKLTNLSYKYSIAQERVQEDHEGHIEKWKMEEILDEVPFHAPNCQHYFIDDGECLQKNPQGS